MKLEAKAKPVKFRIKLGNEEFSNLTSIKEHFSLKDLYPLYKDGRLERWLSINNEKKRAEEVSRISKIYDNESVQDYLLLLSIFFEDVSNPLNNEQPLESYLSNMDLKTLKIVYNATKDMKQIDWGEYIEKIQSKDNIISLFEDNAFHTIYSNTQWAYQFSQFVENNEDYRYFFDYIEKIVRNNPEYANILTDYFYATYNKGYSWDKIFVDNNWEQIKYWCSNPVLRKINKIDWKTVVTPHLSKKDIQFLSDIYQDKSFQQLEIDWGNIFAEAMQDWDKESSEIENTLKHNQVHLNTFYKYCANKGILDAKIKLDPWGSLANSDDYIYVKQALEEWRIGNDKWYKGKYNYFKLNSDLGKEIIDFLATLKDGTFDNIRLSNDFLEEIRKVVIESERRGYNKYSSKYTISEDSKYVLKTILPGPVLMLATLVTETASKLKIKQEAVKLISQELKSKVN